LDKSIPAPIVNIQISFFIVLLILWFYNQPPMLVFTVFLRPLQSLPRLLHDSMSKMEERRVRMIVMLSKRFIAIV
jgi:hypothetical protein